MVQRTYPPIPDCFEEIGQAIIRGADEDAMPQYEYLCKSCEKKFSTILTVTEHDKSKVKCPKCGGTKVEQQWVAFFATTSKKS
jgi:putative FmdB family regulatory protein